MHQDDECHSFLALAIRDPDGIVGVISLANKEKVTSENSNTLSNDSVTATDSNIFTDNDERFVEAFAVFCGMAIRNAADYEVWFFTYLARFWVIAILFLAPVSIMHLNSPKWNFNNSNYYYAKYWKSFQAFVKLYQNLILVNYMHT